MAHEDEVEGSSTIGQAELDALRPTLARIARVAKTMFGAPLADVSLFRGDSIWRASDNKQIKDPASEAVRQAHDVLWVPNLTKDARFAGHPAVNGVPHLRFYAGAPIAIQGSGAIGALAVYGLKPRETDNHLMERLRDLAEMVGHECSRILALSERSALLEQIKRQEQRLEAAVEAANLHVFEIDFVEHTLIKTGMAEDFFDRPLTIDDVMSREYLYIHPEDREQNRRRDNHMLKTGEDPPPVEWRVNRADQRELWVQASARLFRDDAGRPLRMVGSLQNITERKQNEKTLAEAKAFAEAANVAKSVFLATMSHEIRTPLNGVLGMAQAMAADELSSVQRERLDVVRQSGESLLAILNDLLDFSKIEAGKLELEEIEFDLAEIASGAHAAFTALAAKKGLAFTLDVGKALGVYRGDPTRVRQILYNLISNALKFTAEGEIRVTGAFDGETLDLAVSDTGIGMSEETQAGLFDKFAQADASTNRKFGGTGLGLAICRELAALMGGTIGVDSKEGEGSTFRVSLPLPRIGEAGAAKAERQVQAAPQQTGVRLLAAEDNSVNQLVLKTLLSQVGIEPTIVENGALAVEAFEKEAFDVVLMDVQMPVMDGLTAVREIRAFEQRTGRARTPIIALTANAMSHQVAEYLASGMDGHLAKPIEAAKLFETLAAALDGEADAEPAAQRA